MGLGVDFVFPLLQQEQEQKQEQEEEPPPKSIRRGCTRSLKFDIYTTHGLLAEFKGLRVRVTHVTRRIITTRLISIVSKPIKVVVVVKVVFVKRIMSKKFLIQRQSMLDPEKFWVKKGMQSLQLGPIFRTMVWIRTF